MTTRTFNLTDALLSLRPTAEWSLYGNDYAKLIWHHNDSQPPTLEELNVEIARLQQDYNNKLYQRQRELEYPPLKDLADAVYWQSKGDNSKMQAYLMACDAVKQKYPKGA